MQELMVVVVEVVEVVEMKFLLRGSASYAKQRVRRLFSLEQLDGFRLAQEGTKNLYRKVIITEGEDEKCFCDYDRELCGMSMGAP